MTVLKADLLKDLNCLQDRMNRMLTDSVSRLKDIGGTDPDKPWTPPVDIVELEDSFMILVELPGVPRDMISVEVDSGRLVLTGTRPLVEGKSLDGQYHKERKYGEFRRSFNLPVTVTPEQIKAKLADGVLTVTIAKAVETAQRVPVNVE